MPRKPKLAETIEAAPVVTEEIIESVKGFSLSWICRGHQFEISKSYEHNGPVKACKSGFHAVGGNPLEVFSYYGPGMSRYAVVKQSGEIGRHSEDSKIASTKITTEAELKLPALIERAVKWLFANAEAKDVKHAEGYHSAASSTGDRSAASSTGYHSAAMSAGALGRVMGAEGCALFLVYRDPHTWDILHAWAGIAGRDGIKVETWYQLGADGKPVEAAQ